MDKEEKVWQFENTIDNIAVPTTFNYPFYVQKEPLAMLAVAQLKNYLSHQTDFEHNFGLNPQQKDNIIGKMFGVLVVKDGQGNLGFLAGFSGKLANSNNHKRFVPPVFDLLANDSFFLSKGVNINETNSTIKKLNQNKEYSDLLMSFDLYKNEHIEKLKEIKSRHKSNKNERKILREKNSNNEIILNQLKHLSIQDSKEMDALRKLNLRKVAEFEEKIHAFKSELDRLKADRARKSAELQKEIFSNYSFLNGRNEEKSLWSIFHEENNVAPPAGAGECAGPKLLQYAYLNELTPLSLAEFWWGTPPKSEVRKHGELYPSCRGKCEPILGHMLEGINVGKNPLENYEVDHKRINVLYEDPFLIVIAKPHDFLSVPGKLSSDSVQSRMKDAYPNAEDPMIVHRLDMQTSGLMILSKNRRTNKKLQALFTERKIHKTYLAKLQGTLDTDSGIIDLPLALDINDRPRQIVNYEYGKPALTHWKKLREYKGQTWIEMYPKTGRTHQLRVHAAHHQGLNTPMIGDDLYGSHGKRLHLQAIELSFKHPATGEDMHFKMEAEF